MDKGERLRRLQLQNSIRSCEERFSYWENLSGTYPKLAEAHKMIEQNMLEYCREQLAALDAYTDEARL